MNQFIYTEEYRIINVANILYIYIAEDKDCIMTRLGHNIPSRLILTCKSRKEAEERMDEIMTALVQGQSYSVREVEGYNAW